MIACPGAWKNFEDLEDNLTLEELQQIVESFRDLEHQRFKMQAALQGVDLDKERNAQTEFDKVKMRAEAKISGKTEEEYEFGLVGIAVEDWPEEEIENP